MSANPQHPFDRQDGPDVLIFNGTKVAIRPPQPKPQERDTIPRDVKNEIESLRRLAQHIQDRLHELAKR